MMNHERAKTNPSTPTIFSEHSCFSRAAATAASWKLNDGTLVSIRPIRPDDEPLLVEMHRALSERSVYYRYFTVFKIDQRIAHERLSRICFSDYERDLALVAERCNAQTGRSEIVGVGRLSRIPGSNEAEFALLVRDAWQGRGLGTQLLRMLIQVARDQKLARITATILSDNQEMQHLARKAGFTVAHEPGAPEYIAELVL
jgi:acetyltransferase